MTEHAALVELVAQWRERIADYQRRIAQATDEHLRDEYVARAHELELAAWGVSTVLERAQREGV